MLASEYSVTAVYPTVGNELNGLSYLQIRYNVQHIYLRRERISTVTRDRATES
jgi:hypothetical protein